MSPSRNPNGATSGPASKKAETDARVRSTCPYCGVGCGVEAGVKGGKISSIRGDAEHPANFGKLCPKPTGLPEAIHSAHRLTHPLRRTSGGYLARISWDEAVDELSARGSFEERAVISDSVRPGTVFATFHWGELWTSGGGVNEATHGEVCPISKQPELNGAAVRLQPVATGEPESDEQRDYLGSASKTRGIA